MPGGARRPPPPPPGDTPPPLPSRPGPPKPSKDGHEAHVQRPTLPARNQVPLPRIPSPQDEYEVMNPAKPPFVEPTQEAKKTSRDNSSSRKISQSKRDAEKEDVQEDTYLLPDESGHFDRTSPESDDDGWSEEFSDDEVVSKPSMPKPPPTHSTSEQPPALPRRPKKTESNGVGESDDLYEAPEGGIPDDMYEITPGTCSPAPPEPVRKTSKETQKEPKINMVSAIQETLRNLRKASFDSTDQTPQPPSKPRDKTLPTPPSKPTPPTKPSLPSKTSSPSTNPALAKKPLPDLPTLKKQSSGSEDNTSAGSVASDSEGQVPPRGGTGVALLPPSRPAQTSKGHSIAKTADFFTNKVQVLPKSAQHVALSKSPGTTNNKRAQLPPLPTEATQEQPEEDGPSEIYDDAVSLTQLDHYPWFHGSIDRVVGTERLRACHPNQDGNFLVRDSTKTKYTLMVWANGKEYNLNIRERDTDKRFAIGSAKADEMSFKSLDELVDYHRTNCVSVFDKIAGNNISVKLVKSPSKH